MTSSKKLILEKIIKARGAVDVSVDSYSDSKYGFLILENGEEVFFGAFAKWGPGFKAQTANSTLEGNAH